MKELSMLDVAFKVISDSKEPVAFIDIWKAVVQELGISDVEAGKRISTFYTNISTDGRFYNVGENVWGLRSRFTYEQVNAAIDFTREEALDDDLEEEFEDEEFEDEELEEKEEFDDEIDEDDDKAYEEEDY